MSERRKESFSRNKIIIEPDKWKSYLNYIMKRFLKKNDIDFFISAKYCFIAIEDDPLFDLDFVYSSPLIPILVSHLLKYQDLNSDDALVSILQIITILTSFKSPPTQFFSTIELLQVYENLLLNQNQQIVKLVLIIFSQLLYKDSELLSFIYSIKLNESLFNNFLTSPDDDISSVSSFLLCEIAQIDKDSTDSIIQLLFNFSASISEISEFFKDKFANGDENIDLNIKYGIKYSTLFKSILFFASDSPDWLNSIVSNDFCSLCCQILPIVSEIIQFQVDIKKSIFFSILSSIFSILALAINNENGLESFISSNLIVLISQLDLIYPGQNQQLFNIIMDLFAKLIIISNSNINQQIIANEIIEKVCYCALNAGYQNKISAIKFITTIFQSNVKEMCQIILNNNGIQPFFDNFDTLDNDILIFVIQSLISFLSSNPESKELFLAYDIDKLANEIEHKDNDEIDESGHILLDLIQN